MMHKAPDAQEVQKKAAENGLPFYRLEKLGRRALF